LNFFGEGKIPLERPRHRLVDNVKMDFGEIRVVCMEWTGVAQVGEEWSALVNAVMSF
jgi:hypothetical protein